MTSALKLISAIPISENTQRLNEIITKLNREANAALEMNDFKKILSAITDDLNKYCQELEQIYNVINKNRTVLYEYLEGSVKESVRCK